ncbi:hypothetical protein ACPRNU_24845 [Chromobacterium vaccinii]|uniref:hypothetical protein n=1 Tax=Chromobacterium vaccinii TaxID=1108595 RepID=UPI003C77D894
MADTNLIRDGLFHFKNYPLPGEGTLADRDHVSLDNTNGQLAPWQVVDGFVAVLGSHKNADKDKTSKWPNLEANAVLLGDAEGNKTGNLQQKVILPASGRHFILHFFVRSGIPDSTTCSLAHLNVKMGVLNKVITCTKKWQEYRLPIDTAGVKELLLNFHKGDVDKPPCVPLLADIGFFSAVSASQLKIVDGNEQFAFKGTAFSRTLQVIACKIDGTPLPNVPITFTIKGSPTSHMGVGNIRSLETSTGRNGQPTQVELWGGMDSPTLFHVEAISGSAKVVFNLYLGPEESAINIVASPSEIGVGGVGINNAKLMVTDGNGKACPFIELSLHLITKMNRPAKNVYVFDSVSSGEVFKTVYANSVGVAMLPVIYHTNEASPAKPDGILTATYSLESAPKEVNLHIEH